MTCLLDWLTCVSVVTASPTAPFATVRPPATCVTPSVACCEACDSIDVPVSSVPDVFATNVLSVDCVAPMSCDVLVSPLLASVARRCTSFNASRACCVLAGVCLSVSVSSLMLPRVFTTSRCAVSREARVFVWMVPAVVPALSVALLTACARTSLTVETKVPLTCVSTVLAPTSVIFGAMALAFSFT